VVTVYQTNRDRIPEETNLHNHRCERFKSFLATDPEDPGSIPGAIRFSEK
jgi:hypothetical protein